MKNTFVQTCTIGNKVVGENAPCLIIAEAGSNYNGSLEIAKKLVDTAAEANADIVKFQTFKAELIVTRTTPKAQYQKQGENDSESYYDLLKGLEMKDEEWQELKNYCDQKGIIFMSTPHSGAWSVDFLESLHVPAYKLGSGDLTNLPFLEYVAEKNKPIIISVGMSVMEEIKEAVEVIKKTGNNQLVVLQCTTSYPADIKNINLNVMDTLAAELGCIIGFSDHTPGIEASVIAVAKGARVIEKHFTIDKNLPGPDHKASLDPTELKALVQGIRHVERMLGSKEKQPTQEELDIAKIARKSIVAAKDIPKGILITEDMLIIKRPGTGILPKYFPDIIGKKAKSYIEKDSILSYDMIE